MSHLVRIAGGRETVIALERDLVVLGRERGCAIPVRDRAASRRHCALARTPEGWELRDLGSQNGTRVNGRPVTVRRLEPGDRIAIGRVRFVFDPPADGSPARTRARLERLPALTAALNSALPPGELLPLVLDAAIELTGAQRACLVRRQPDGSWQFVAARADDGTDVADPAASVSRAVIERVWAEGQPLHTDDAQQDARLAGSASVKDRRLRSVACVPLRVRGPLAGVLYVDNPLQRGVFTADDLGVLATFADHAALALTLARPDRVARTGGDGLLTAAGEDLALLSVVSRVARAGLDFDALAEMLAGILLEVLRADRAAVVVRDPTGGLRTVAVAREGRAAAGERLCSTGIVAAALAARETVLVADATSDPRFRDRGSVRDLHIASAVAAALPAGVADAPPLGALYADTAGAGRAFGSGDATWLAACAREVAGPLRNALDHGRVLAESRAVQRDYTARLDELTARFGYGRLLGQHESMQRVYATCERLRGSTVPVLIVGESGTGKELVARILHQQSPRRDGPFCSENCAALAESLLEPELFGYVRGAFTGADEDREGLLARAHGGTLFLDECGEMSAALQGRLLRALETGRHRPVGGAAERASDVRLLAATNRDLDAAVAAGAFRADLYYRLRVVTVALPPLRERRSDIPLLTSHFLAEVGAERGTAPREVTPEAMARLAAYGWPGNVRELRNELVRAALLTEGPIGPDALSPVVGADAPGADLAALDGRSLHDVLRARERELIEAALKATSGNKARAARMLGLSWLGLSKKIQRMGIVVPGAGV